jgi:glutamine phosphoribosylpyrophosphate amidotransferase
MSEKKTREETEEAILEMLRIMITKTKSEIETILDVDNVIYNDLNDVIESCCMLNLKNVRHMETSCFDGNYIT